MAGDEEKKRRDDDEKSNNQNEFNKRKETQHFQRPE
jgi:hypothetical protein